MGDGSFLGYTEWPVDAAAFTGHSFVVSGCNSATLRRARGVIDGAQRVLDRLVNVPVDIEPRFVTAAALAGRWPD